MAKSDINTRAKRLVAKYAKTKMAKGGELKLESFEITAPKEKENLLKEFMEQRGIKTFDAKKVQRFGNEVTYSFELSDMKNLEDFKGMSMKYGFKFAQGGSITDADKEKIKEIIKTTKFMDLRKPLEAAGFIVDFDTYESPMPPAIYTVTKTKGKGNNENAVVILNKKYADEPEFVFGETAMGEMKEGGTFGKGGGVEPNTKRPILNVEIKKRTFEAEKFPKDSPERKKLNEDALTSEYMHSHKYIVYVHLGSSETHTADVVKRNFNDKKSAEDYKSSVESTGKLFADGGGVGEEDIEECKKLASAFEKRYGSIFGIKENELLEKVKFRDWLGYGADVSFGGSVESNIEHLSKGEVKPTSLFASISTGINPAGISKNEIERTYNLEVEIKGHKRITKGMPEHRYFFIYKFARTIDDLLKEIEPKINELNKLIAKDKIVFKNVDALGNGGGVGSQYYVEWSSWFDSHPYDIEKIKEALTKTGATNIHTENDRGWSNQPEVVVFSGDKNKAESAVNKALESVWITVRKKDWRSKKLAGGGAINYYSITPFKAREGTPSMIETDFKSTIHFEGNYDGAVEKATELLNSNPIFVEVSVTKNGKTLTSTKKVALVSHNGVRKLEEGGGVGEVTRRLSDEYKNQSISHATLKTEHLIDRFMSFLEGVYPKLRSDHKQTFDKIKAEVDSLKKDKHGDFENEETADDILNEDIWDLLNEIAPNGTSFGASDGDGSDFGFWGYDEEGEEFDKGGTIISNRRAREIANGWHGGLWSALYQFVSSGTYLIQNHLRYLKEIQENLEPEYNNINPAFLKDKHKADLKSLKRWFEYKGEENGIKTVWEKHKDYGYMIPYVSTETPDEIANKVTPLRLLLGDGGTFVDRITKTQKELSKLGLTGYTLSVEKVNEDHYQLLYYAVAGVGGQEITHDTKEKLTGIAKAIAKDYDNIVVEGEVIKRAGSEFEKHEQGSVIEAVETLYKISVSKKTNPQGEYQITLWKHTGHRWTIDDTLFVSAENPKEAYEKAVVLLSLSSIEINSDYSARLYEDGSEIKDEPRSQQWFDNLVAEKSRIVGGLTSKEVSAMWNANDKSNGIAKQMTEEEAKSGNARMYLSNLLVENELTEAEYNKYFAIGGEVKGNDVWSVERRKKIKRMEEEQKAERLEKERKEKEHSDFWLAERKKREKRTAKTQMNKEYKTKSDEGTHYYTKEELKERYEDLLNSTEESDREVKMELIEFLNEPKVGDNWYYDVEEIEYIGKQPVMSHAKGAEIGRYTNTHKPAFTGEAWTMLHGEAIKVKILDHIVSGVFGKPKQWRHDYIVVRDGEKDFLGSSFRVGQNYLASTEAELMEQFHEVKI